MKKFIFYLAMLFLLALLAYKLFFYFDKKSEQKAILKNEAVTRLSNEELAKIEEGDFILRRGFGFFSDYVSKELNAGFIDVTHAGIIIKRNDSLYVVHSLSSDVTDIDGLQIQPLSEFLKYSFPKKIIITRVKNCNKDMGTQISQLAQKYLAMHIPFDHNGNFDDDEKFFCTEMIWKILEKDLHCVSLPTDAEARKKFFFSMSPMYDTKYFDIKINQYDIENK